jgi:flagellar hook-associated protein 3 FlgL
MSLRITQSMSFQRSLRDIQLSTRGSVRLQQEIASGRRVNRPSDDAAGTLRILPLRAQIRDLDQVLDNVGIAKASLATGASMLEEGSAVLQRLRELLMQGSNPRSQSDRETIAGEIDQLLQQMLGIANTKDGDRYLFAGGKTNAPPFTRVDDGGGTRIRYQGDQERITIEVAPGVTTTLTLPGDSIFQKHVRGPTRFLGTTGAVPSGATDSGVGFGKLLVTFSGLQFAAGTTGMTQGDTTTNALGNLAYTYNSGANTLSIDGGPATTITGGVQSFPVGTTGRTVSLNVSGPIVPPTGTILSKANLSFDGGRTTTEVASYAAGAEVQVRNSYDGTVVNVGVASLVTTGSEQITFEGTFDVFTTLIAVRDTLRNTLGLTSDQQSQRLTWLLGQVDGAHDDVLDGLHDRGSRGEQLTMLGNRVEGLRVIDQEQLSLLEDTDFADAVLRMNHQDLTYQTALRVSARIVQTTLLDYLQ